MAAIEPPLDLRTGAAQPRADDFPRHAPALALQLHRMVGRHGARHADTQDLLQALFPFQPPMRILGLPRRNSEALVPLRQEGDVQKTVGRLPAVDSGHAHLLDQPVLQGAEGALDAPLGLWTVRGDPLDAQFAQGPAELRAGRLAAQLLVPRSRTGRLKNAVFIGVQSQGRP